MAELTPQARLARRSLLALMMAMVLAGSVAVAWLMERAGRRRVDAGAEVIADLRAKGLADEWPRELQIDWYLLRASARPVGWRAIARWRIGNGDLAGTDITIHPKRSGMEQWVLSPDMTRGRYSSVEPSGREARRTDILLEGGVVTVRQYDTRQVASPAPANYIPEGALSVVVRRSALLKDDAQFSIVFNERLSRLKTIDFGTIRVRRLGETEAGGLRARRSESCGGRMSHTDYEFDKDGRIVSTAADNGVRTMPVSAEKVAKHYREADQQVRSAIENWQRQLQQPGSE